MHLGCSGEALAGLLQSATHSQRESILQLLDQIMRFFVGEVPVVMFCPQRVHR